MRAKPREYFKRNERIWCEIWIEEFKEKASTVSEAVFKKLRIFLSRFHRIFVFEDLLIALLKITNRQSKRFSSSHVKGQSE